MGPTGVGKTEMARALAEFLFNDEDALVRVDMSEYMEKHATSKLIGSPPGYVGYEEGGQLTEIVRRRPYSVLLFDEIEKAHPDVFNIMLQILDDGHATDAKGRKINFKNTVIVMTSNIASEEILAMGRRGEFGFEEKDNGKKSAEKEQERMKKKVMEGLKEHFKPEFLNRIDEIITFHPLDTQEIRHIVDLQITRVAERLKEQKIILKVTDKAKDWLAKKGYDPQMGARPLKRLIQTALLDPLALDILDGKIAEGSTVNIGAEKDALTFK